MNKRALKRVGATPGIYKRDNTYYAGYSLYGKWTITALDAESVTEAKKARESLLAGLREGRIAQRNGARFSECFDEYQGARSLSERTREHERHLCDRHLSALVDRPVQDVTASDIAKLLRGMRDGYSPWTQVAVFRVLVGTFALATRRGIITRNPMDGLARSEKPKQRNARRVAVLDADAIAKLAHAGGSERWTAAIALAGYAGLRLGEIRALRWSDVVLDGETISVRRSLLPDGTVKATKTEAGTRTVPLLPALRRALVAWRLRSPRTDPEHYVLCTAEGSPVSERNLRRALDQAKARAKLAVSEAERLSWHSLRHSYASILATDLELPATTLARLTGHADAGFTLRVYARDRRDEDDSCRGRSRAGCRSWHRGVRPGHDANLLKPSRGGCFPTPRSASRSVVLDLGQPPELTLHPRRGEARLNEPGELGIFPEDVVLDRIEQVVQLKCTDVWHHFGAVCVAPGEPLVWALFGIAVSETLRPSRHRRPRTHVENRHALDPVLQEVPAVDQFVADRRVKSDAGRRVELERFDKMSGCNEHEVMLDGGVPDCGVLERGPAAEVGAYRCGDERLPPLELPACRDRPQQPLPVGHPLVEVRPENHRGRLASASDVAGERPTPTPREMPSVPRFLVVGTDMSRRHRAVVCVLEAGWPKGALSMATDWHCRCADELKPSRAPSQCRDVWRAAASLLASRCW